MDEKDLLKQFKEKYYVWAGNIRLSRFSDELVVVGYPYENSAGGTSFREEYQNISDVVKNLGPSISLV